MDIKYEKVNHIHYSNENLIEKIQKLEKENNELILLVNDAHDIISSGDSYSWFGFDGIGWQEKAGKFLEKLEQK